MKDFDFNQTQLQDIAADSATSQAAQEAALESHLAALQDRLRELSDSTETTELTSVQLEISRTLVALGRGEEAWPIARGLFDPYIQAGDWNAAADCCNLLFLAEQPASLSALGQGIWLAVTYPSVDTGLAVSLLEHVVDETPSDSDGAAVAAAVAMFLVDLRTVGQERENLGFFVGQMLGRVAREHSEVETQEAFDRWMDRLELNDPDKFLPRLRNVVDVLVQDDWWFDREALQTRLPIN
jgi:hypothetical protein